MGKQVHRHNRLIVRAVLGAGALAFASGGWHQVVRAAAITTTWDGSNGDWFDPAHWSAGVPNNSADTFSAIINNGTVSLSASATINSLTMASDLFVGPSATLDLSGVGSTSTVSGVIELGADSTLSVSQTITLQNGASVRGDGIFQQTGGVVAIFGGASVDHFVLAGGTVGPVGPLTINDTMTWVNGSMYGSLLIAANATLQFMATSNQVFTGSITNAGVSVVQGAASYQESGTFINSGTLIITDPATNFSISTLTNGGVISLASGALDLHNATLGGTLSLAQNTVIRYDGGVTLQNAMLTGSAGLVSNGGSLTLSGTSTAQNFAFGTLLGAGTLNLQQSGVWTGGTLTGGGLRVLPGGQLVMQGTAHLTSSAHLINDGTASIGVDTVGNFSSSYLDLTGGGTIQNNGTLTVEGSISASTAGTLTNTGLITNYSTVLNARPTISVTILNTGTISGGFILGSGTSSGLLSPDAGAFARTLTLGGPWTLLPGASISSAAGGRVVATGSLTITGVLLADHLQFSSVGGTGTLTSIGPNTWSGVLGAGTTLLLPASGQLTFQNTPTLNGNFVNNSTLFLTSNITGVGTLTNNDYLTANATSSPTLSARVVNNGTIGGPITLSGGGTNSGVLTGDLDGTARTLTLSGTFTLNPGTHITSTNGSVVSSGTLVLVGESYADHLTFSSLSGSGTLDLSGPDKFSSLGFINSGVVHVLPGALLDVRQGTVNGTLINDGTVTGVGASGSGRFFNDSLVDGGTSGGSISCPFYNLGTVTTAGGLGISTGSASGLFVASTTNSQIDLGSPAAGFIIDNASLSGPGTYWGTVTLRDANTVINSQLSFNGTGSMVVTGACYAPAVNTGAVVTVTGLLSGVGSIMAATLTNLGSGTLTTFPTLRSGARFINQGTLVLQAISFTSANDSSQFINQGVVSTQGGPFQFTGNGTYNSFSNTGTVTLAGGGSFYSAGDYSGTFITNSSNGILFAGAIANSVVSLRDAVLEGGPYFGSVSLTGVTAGQTIDFVSIGGPGSLTVSGSWTPTVQTGAPNVTINGGAHVTLLATAKTVIDSVTTFGTLAIDNGAVTNQGSFSIYTSGSFTGAPVISFAHGAVLDNQGIFVAGDINRGAIFSSDGNAANTFLNSGAFSYSDLGVFGPPGAAGLRMDVPMQNSGHVTISGNATFNGALNNPGEFTEGAVAFNSFTGQIIFINGGGYATGRFDAVPTTVSPLTVNFETVFSAPYTLDNATLSGDYRNTAALTILGTVQGQLNISGDFAGSGTFVGGGAWLAGSLANGGGVDITGGGSFRVLTGTLGLGPVVVSDLSLLGSNGTKALDGTTMQIAAGASVSWARSSTIGKPSSPDAVLFRHGGQFINNGTFYTYLPAVSLLSADSHTGNAFINTGIFGRSSLTPNSTLPAITTVTVPFHNSGLVDVQQGSIDFAGGYFNDGGTLQFAAGTGFSFSGGSYDFGAAPMDLGLGGLSGTGTVRGDFTSDGTISPGHSPGALTVDGDLHLEPAASVSIELAGSSPGTLFDTLTVTGALDLDGTLNLTLLNGYLPTAADSFEFLTATALNGTFLNAPDGARFPDAGSHGTFLVTYAGTSVSLSDFQVAVPEPLSLAWLSPGIILLLRRRVRRSSAGASHSPFAGAVPACHDPGDARCAGGGEAGAVSGVGRVAAALYVSVGPRFQPCVAHASAACMMRSQTGSLAST